MKTILIVEDDPQIRAMLRNLLEDEGYRVHTAPDGFEAVEYIYSQEKPDLIISDVMMPILDGGNLVSIMHAKYGDDPTPVLGITALSQLKRSVDTHFDVVFHKPFDVESLLSTISDLLKNPPHVSSIK